MVNFMGQLDWATGHPDMWSAIILAVSVQVSWMRLIFQSDDQVKQIAHVWVGLV